MELNEVQTHRLYGILDLSLDIIILRAYLIGGHRVEITTRNKQTQKIDSIVATLDMVMYNYMLNGIDLTRD